MPIVRTYGDPAVFGLAGYEAGTAQARAARNAQQREIDARFTENRLAARERITEIETLNNYAQERGVPTYAPSRERGKESSVFDEYAARRDQDRDRESQSNDEREGILDGLNQAYSGRDKDFTYFYARDRIMKGETLPDRVLSALGIRSVSEEKALAKARAEEENGLAEYQPKSATERAVRSSITQGRIGDVAAMLDDREKPAQFGQEGALSTDALAARTQLAAAAADISDRDTLIEMQKELEKSGSSEAVREILGNRLAEIDEETTKVKAPAAFEQVVSSFKTQLAAAQKQKGTPLDITERRKMLASTIKTTRESFGLSAEQFAAYIRQSEEHRRMSELMLLKAQDEIQNQQQQTPPAPQNPQDPRQQRPQPGPLPAAGGGATAPRRPAFGQRGAPQ